MTAALPPLLQHRYQRVGAPGTAFPTLEAAIDVIQPSVDDLDPVAVIGYLSRPFAPLPPRTFFRNIEVVAPSAEQVDEAFADLTTKNIRSIKPDTRLSLDDARDQLLTLLVEVAASYVDRPTALTLSAGMDSSSLLAALSVSGAEVLAIAWSAPSVPSADETPWARQTASRLGYRLIEQVVDPDTMLPEQGIVSRRPRPNYNIFTPLWHETARIAADNGRQQLLTGFSGDHLVGLRISPAADLLCSLRLVKLWTYSQTARPRHRNWRHYVRREMVSPLARQHLTTTWSRRQTPVSWLHPARHDAWQELQRETVYPGVKPGATQRVGAFTSGLIPSLAEELAATANQHGVDVAHPLLDGRLIEFALSLPTWLLNDGRTEKLVLRAAMRHLLPDDVLKLRVILPREIALRALRARQDALMELTNGMRAAELGFISEDVFRAEAAAFMRGEHDNTGVWQGLTLESWLRQWT